MEEIEKKETDSKLLIEERRWQRITISNILHSILDAFNLERGGIYTLKRLFSNPGKMAMDYIGEKRFYFTPPFRLLLLSTALVIYLLSELGIGEDFFNGFTEGLTSGGKDITDRTEVISEIVQSWGEYMNLVLWTLIPILALLTYIFNLKKSYNFAEHLVMQAYFFSLTNILTLIVLLKYFIDISILLNILSILSITYFVYFYKVLFLKGIWRSILDCVVIYIVATFIWLIVLGVLFTAQVSISVS